MARQTGDLSHDDYLKELKRRGILRADFDISANDDRLLQEVPLASWHQVPMVTSQHW